MAIVYCCGFELNSLAVEFNSTAGAAMTVQSSVARSGTYAARVNGLSSGTRSGAFKQINNAADFAFRTYLRVDTAPSAENRIIAFASAIGTHAYYVTLGNDRALRLYNDANVLKATSSALTVGAWYRVELDVALGATDTVHLTLDGSSVGSFADGASTAPNGFFLGGNGNSEAQTAGDWYFDDVAASGNTTLPGAGSLVCLRPNAAGDFAEGAVGGTVPVTGAGNEWQNVDEVTPNDGTDYWELQTDASAGSGNADRLDVNIESFAPSASSITYVAVGVRAKPLTNAACSFVPRIKSQASGTVVEGTTASITGTAWITNDDTANASIYKLVRTTDPQAGGAWTQALLGTTQIGVRAPDGNPNVDITALWAYVEYIPAAGGATRPVKMAGNWGGYAGRSGGFAG